MSNLRCPFARPVASSGARRLASADAFFWPPVPANIFSPARGGHSSGCYGGLPRSTPEADPLQGSAGVAALSPVASPFQWCAPNHHYCSSSSVVSANDGGNGTQPEGGRGGAV